MKQRSVNIELLRIVSMFMVVMLHCLGQGGVIAHSHGSAYNLTWLAETFCFGAVNLFALISGYVGVTARHRWGKVLLFWVETFFYYVLCTLAVVCLTDYSLRTVDVLLLFFPISNKAYWYMTAYFALLCFRPFVNRLIEHLSKTEFRTLLRIGFLLFASVGCLIKDAFATVSGYSFVWLLYLYFVGAYFRTYPETRSKWLNLLLYVVLSLIAYFMKFYIIPNTGGFMGTGWGVSYTSPFIFLASLELFLFFTKLRCPDLRIVREAASVTLPVYLIHVSPAVFSQVMKNCLVRYCRGDWRNLFVALAAAFVIYVACSLLGYAQKKLFSLLRIPALCDRLTTRRQKTAP